MFRYTLRIITFLINDFTFLHFKGGFWFITIPFILFLVYISKINKNKINSTEDFIDKEVEELSLYSIEFKVNKDEKWKIGQVLKRTGYNNIDDLVKDLIENI